MRENNKIRQESDAAFAFASFLLNLLVLLAVCGSVWMIQSLAEQSNELEVFLRETALR